MKDEIKSIQQKLINNLDRLDNAKDNINDEVSRSNAISQYVKEFEIYVREKAKTMTKKQLYKHVIEKFNLKIAYDTFGRYLLKHNIRCIGYNQKCVSIKPKYAIGSERTRKGHLTEIKIAQPNVWEYKNRYLYKKYHNCELSSDDYIVFLNQDRNDFSKDNLIKISRKESAILSAKRNMTSKNKDITKLGILIAKLMIKAKEKNIC